MSTQRHYQIKTVFYRFKKIVRINHAMYPINAVDRCVHHMQLGDYDATVAEVFDTATGELHAVLTRNLKGIRIIFKRDNTTTSKGE